MYVQLALIGDVDTLTDIGRTYLEQSMGPNWVARAGNPETILIEGSGQIAAELIDQASLVPPEALVAIGTSIYNIPMNSGTHSVASATITFAPDTPASIVPVDSEVAVPHPSGAQMVFLTDREAIAPDGGGDILVNLISLDVGENYNGAFGSSQLIDIFEGVSGVVAETSSGGSDDETAEAYLDRLTSALTIPRRPVLPADHSNLALQVPGVFRASAFNLLYPGTTELDAGRAVGDFNLWQPQPAPTAAQPNVARCTTIAIMGDGGTAPTLDLMNRVYNELNSNREVNFLNFVVSPIYTAIDIRANIKPYSGTNATDAETSAENMVRDWLDPFNWNSPPSGFSGVWEPDKIVRLYEAVDYINRASGVWYCENVEMKLQSEGSGSWRTTDITLPGLVAVPTAGTGISITAI